MHLVQVGRGRICSPKHVLPPALVHRCSAVRGKPRSVVFSSPAQAPAPVVVSSALHRMARLSPRWPTTRKLPSRTARTTEVPLRYATSPLPWDFTSPSIPWNSRRRACFHSRHRRLGLPCTRAEPDPDPSPGGGESVPVPVLVLSAEAAADRERHTPGMLRAPCWPTRKARTASAILSGRRSLTVSETRHPMGPWPSNTPTKHSEPPSPRSPCTPTPPPERQCHLWAVGVQRRRCSQGACKPGCAWHCQQGHGFTSLGP